MRAPAAADAARGFSTKAWTPARASASAASSWWTVGAATMAASMPARISAWTSGRTSRGPATPWGSPAGSASATTSKPGVARALRTWWRPIEPRPRIPTRTGARPMAALTIPRGPGR